MVTAVNHAPVILGYTKSTGNGGNPVFIAKAGFHAIPGEIV
jgi:hypothetical protein